MSANDRNGAMPEPHAAIAIKVSQWGECGFEVEYKGTPAQLMAAGIVDDFMQDKILHQRSGAMLNRKGHHFRVLEATATRRRPKRTIWEASESICRVEYGVWFAAVLDMPGVAALFPDGLQEYESPDERARPELLATIKQLGAVSLRMHQLDEQGERMRHRIVGRRRREASWYALGDVLFVNWAEIARDRVLARV